MIDRNNSYIAPAHRPAPQFAPAEDTASQSHLPEVVQSMQIDAARLKEPEASLPHLEHYKISVDDIRVKLHNIGISKSKDTIQRYCREGSLDCQKLGMLKRYFATEKSVGKLIEKILSDASVPIGAKVHAGASFDQKNELPVYEAATDKDNPKNIDLHAGADSGSQVHEDARIISKKDTTEAKSHDGKIVEMLERQIDDKDKTILFLQGELVARRGAVSALEKIIDAFGDNAQASLLSAENDRQWMNQSRDNQQGSDPTEVVHDIHSDQKMDNHASDYRV